MNAPPKICRNCRRPLNAWQLNPDAEVEYMHGAADCGQLDPIDPDGGPVVYACDFCLAANPVWAFPADPMKDPNLTFTQNRETGEIEYVRRDVSISDAEWACCANCKPLVENEDWRALWARNSHIQEVRENAPDHYHTARLAVLKLWIEFSKHRTGPPFRTNHQEVTP